MLKTMDVNGRKFRVEKLLGKGKGGYSWLVSDNNQKYVLKQIHHEPCSYYTFGNKLESELRDYETLKNTGLPLPEMLDVDKEQERILKQYIDGPTIFDLVLTDCVRTEYFEQMQDMINRLYPNHLNIDYFPTNFVVENGKLFYIDYECNLYDEKWNFENWGIRYWSRTPEFLDYLSSKKESEESAAD